MPWSVVHAIAASLTNPFMIMMSQSLRIGLASLTSLNFALAIALSISRSEDKLDLCRRAPFPFARSRGCDADPTVTPNRSRLYQRLPGGSAEGVRWSQHAFCEEQTQSARAEEGPQTPEAWAAG